MKTEFKHIPIYKQIIEGAFLNDPVASYSFMKESFYVKKHNKTDKTTIYHESILDGYLMIPVNLSFEIVQCENGKENLFFHGDELPYSPLALITKTWGKRGTKYIKIKGEKL